MLAVPSDELQLKTFRDQNSTEISHFYFPVKQSPKTHSDLFEAQIESAIHLLQNMTFDRCSIIVPSQLSNSDDFIQEIAYKFSENGIDAEAWRDQETVLPRGAKRNVIVHFVDCSQSASGSIEAYLGVIGKFLCFGPGSMNVILNLVDSKKANSWKEGFADGPLFIHKVPGEPGLWKDLRKLKAFAEQSTVQALKELSLKIFASRKTPTVAVSVQQNAVSNGKEDNFVVEGGTEKVKESLEEPREKIDSFVAGKEEESKCFVPQLHIEEAIDENRDEKSKSIDEKSECKDKNESKNECSTDCKDERSECSTDCKIKCKHQPTDISNDTPINLCLETQALNIQSNAQSSQPIASPKENPPPTKIKNSLFKTASSLFCFSSPTTKKPFSPC